LFLGCFWGTLRAFHGAMPEVSVIASCPEEHHDRMVELYRKLNKYNDTTVE